VLAAEMPAGVDYLYAHFLHTPASVTRYAGMIVDMPWSCSAHAKDIWTSPEWELREKLADVQWLVTCTSFNVTYLQKLAKDPTRISLLYHGLDLKRFRDNAAKIHRRDGSCREDPVQLLSVGRAVAKKGFADLLHALKQIPRDIHWQFTHIGGGPLLPELRKLAHHLGIDSHITWLGALPQGEVLWQLQQADIFVLASRVAADGDRDGLPNVLMEAQSQRVAIVSTAVSAIPELVMHEQSGLLVAEGNPEAFAAAIETLAVDPALRSRYAARGAEILKLQFDNDLWIHQLSNKFRIRNEPEPVVGDGVA
jgi:glycosyltransferase involved in cell wall biosynthesis